MGLISERTALSLMARSTDQAGGANSACRRRRASFVVAGVAADADHGRRRAAERLFADDRFARLSGFLADQEGDARQDPEGRRRDRLLSQQGGLEPRLAAARGPSASFCRRCRIRSTCPSSRAPARCSRATAPTTSCRPSTMPAGASRTPSAPLLSQRVRRSCSPRSGTRRRPKDC